MKRIWFLVAGVVLVLGIGAGLVFGLGNGPKTYTVEITSNVEQIEYESKNNCRLGDNVTIEAIPLDGYRFIGWEVNGVIVSEDVEYEITLNQENVNNVYKAVYKQEFTIYAGEVQNGNVASNVTKAIEGETITLTITPNDHYAFESAYYILDSETEHIEITNQTFTMPNGNVTVYANFQAIEYTITSAELEHGTLSFLPTVGTYGIEIVVTVTPDTGYELTPNSLHYTTENIANGEIAYTNGIYSFIMPGEDVTVYASFYRTTFNITVPSQQTGYTIKNTNNNTFTTNSAQYGDSISFVIELKNGYTGTPIVTNEGNDVVTNENGVYTISTVTDDVSILVSGITLEEYILTFPEEVTVTRNNIQLTSGATIYYGDILTLSPTTAPTEGITPVYAINGTETTSNNITVAGNVTIEYFEIMDASEYQALLFTYNSTAKTATVKANSSSNPTGELVIPSKVSYNNEIYNVTGINSTSNSSKGAFYNCSNLTNVIIPDGVTSIGSQAFYGCSSLTSITIPNSVTSIGSQAFYGCSSLTSITIPNSVTSIGSYAFRSCSSLTSVTIPNSVTSIGEDAFSNCSSLTNITIPNGVTIIGSYAFERCSSLTSVTIPNSVTSIGYHAFYYCSSLTSIAIPNSVTSIGIYAFGGCSSLTNVTIPDSVTSMGDYAFSGCSSLTSVTIENIESWLNISFGSYNSNPLCYAHHLYIGNNEVTELIIPEGITEIKSHAFERCSSLTSVIIGSGVTSIGDSAFYNCSSLTSIVIPNGVTRIGNSAFYGCSSLTSITIPNGVTSIGNSTFYDCSCLTSVTIPNSVTSIGDWAFDGCYALAEVYNKSGLTIIKGTSDYGYVGKYAEVVYSGDEIDTPSKIEEIDGIAYYKRSDSSYIALVCLDKTKTTISLDSRTTKIESFAFSGCYALAEVYNKSLLNITKGSSAYGKVAYYAEVVYSGDEIDTPSQIEEIDGVKYYKESDTSYIALKCTDKTKTTIILDSRTTRIKDCVFSGCTSLTSITIPNSVTSIGERAFHNCSSLTSVTIPNSVTSIGSNAFYNCSSLTSISIPNSVTSIRDYAFYNCSSLTSVTVGSGVTSIGNSAFNNCSSLTSVTIGSGVTSMGDYAFSGCSSLTSVTIENIESWLNISFVDMYSNPLYYARHLYIGNNEVTDITIPEGITEIKNYAFYGCSSLTSVTIGSGVTSIGNYAFSGCSSLTNVTIPNSVTSIGERAFHNCSSLTSISIPNSVTSIRDYAFYNCSSLTSVTVGSGVTSIGSQAFCNCSSLTSVTIGSSVTSIGDSAFSGCFALAEVYNISALTITKGNTGNGLVARFAVVVYSGNEIDTPSKIEVIDGVAYYKESEISYITVALIDKTKTSISLDSRTIRIKDQAFYNCSSLTSVTIPNSVTSIGQYAFCNCRSLTNITIPNSVTSIGDSAFYGCSSLYIVNNLSQLNITAGNNNYGYVANYAHLVVSDENFVDKLEEIDGVMYYKENSTNYKAVYATDETITSVIINENTTEICYKAFYNCSHLDSVIITSIESWLNISFNNEYSNPLYNADHLYIGNNEVTELIIPEGISEIKSYAFYDCRGLTSVTISNSVTSIGNSAFYNCINLYIVNNLSQLNITAGNSDYGYVASYAHLVVSDVNFADKLEEIDGVMYYKQSSTNYKAVYVVDTTITSVILNQNTTEICSKAFSSCGSLTSITIPNSVTSIGNHAFEYCSSLTSITIPESVTSIGDYAFIGCRSLTSVTIPNSVTSIGDLAFSSCSKLYIVNNLSQLNITARNSDYGYVAYYAHLVVSDENLADKLEEIDGVMYYKESSTNYKAVYVVDKTITSVTLNENTTEICYQAFYDCRSLTSVKIGSGVTSIGSDAFRYCYALAEVYNLSSLNITKGSEDYGYVGKYAEYIQKKANSASRINIIDGVAYYVNGSEFVAIGLIDKTITTLTFDERTTKIRGNSFRDCDNLRYVIVSNNVTKISDNAFCDCNYLNSIYISNSVTTISVTDNLYYNAPFYGCSSNLHIYVEESSKPSGWKSKWNYYDSSNQYDTNWGYSLDLYKALIDYYG